MLFSAPMVRAILEGRKTQTRRIVKPQPDYVNPLGIAFWTGKGPVDYRLCPYGVEGDWLWVKETFQAHPIYGSPVYRADWQTSRNPVEAENWPWRPSIFMPRRLSRLTLKIEGVRVERLQDISESDAEAEGVEEIIEKQSGHIAWKNYQGKDLATLSARFSYRTLWDSLNAKRGFGWDINPWVWALTFNDRRQESTAGEGQP